MPIRHIFEDFNNLMADDLPDILLLMRDVQHVIDNLWFLGHPIQNSRRIV